MDDALFDKLEAIEALAGELSTTMLRYVLAWTLCQSAMTSLVVGAKRIEQVEDAIASTDVAIPCEHLERMDAICPPPWKQADPIR